MSIRTCAAALLLAGATIQPACAATYLVTYTGTVASGEDRTGEFGAASGNLAGANFTLVYTLISPLAGTDTVYTPTTASTRGGATYNAPAPVSAVLTINGISQAISGASSSGGFHTDQGSNDGVSYDAADYLNQHVNIVYSGIGSSSNIFDVPDFSTPFSYTLQDGDYRVGGFQIYEYLVDNGGLVETRNVNGVLNNETVTFAAAAVVAPGVPEPATWAMMIVGFGAVGIGRRRRSKAVAQFASA